MAPQPWVSHGHSPSIAARSGVEHAMCCQQLCLRHGSVCGSCRPVCACERIVPRSGGSALPLTAGQRPAGHHRPPPSRTRSSLPGEPAPRRVHAHVALCIDASAGRLHGRWHARAAIRRSRRPHVRPACHWAHRRGCAITSGRDVSRRFITASRFAPGCLRKAPHRRALSKAAVDMAPSQLRFNAAVILRGAFRVSLLDRLPRAPCRAFLSNPVNYRPQKHAMPFIVSLSIKSCLPFGCACVVRRASARRRRESGLCEHIRSQSLVQSHSHSSLDFTSHEL